MQLGEMQDWPLRVTRLVDHAEREHGDGEIVSAWADGTITREGRGLFAGMSNPFDATRYHSLVIKKETWTNPDFEVSAWTAEGEIMGVRHKTWPLHGVQFHPESFLTVEGPAILKNFLDLAPWK